jgi:hypothetical protein
LSNEIWQSIWQWDVDVLRCRAPEINLYFKKKIIWTVEVIFHWTSQWWMNHLMNAEDQRVYKYFVVPSRFLLDLIHLMLYLFKNDRCVEFFCVLLDVLHCVASLCIVDLFCHHSKFCFLLSIYGNWKFYLRGSTSWKIF